MNQNVLSHINNSAINNKAITKATLQKLRDQQKQKGDNNQHNALQLLRILGGIDSILDSYLSSNDLNLNVKQLNEIHAVLSQKTHIRHSTFLQPLASTKNLFSDQDTDNKIDHGDDGDNDDGDDDDDDGDDGDDGEHDQFYYTFYTSDTFLHQMMNAKIARKLINMSYSKTFYVFLMMLFVGWVALIGTLGIGNSSIIPIYAIFMNCLFIPTEILVILSANRYAFKLVIASFEFWFKVVYTLSVGILISIYYTNSSNIKYKVLTTIEIIVLLIIVFPLFITALSMFDAVHLSRLTKSVVSIVVACVATGFMIYFQFYISADHDLIVYVTSSHSFSMLSTISSVLRVLSIFIWKQLFNQLRRQNKGQCVMIKYTPYMKWINDTKKENETANLLPMNNQNDNDDANL